MWKLLGGLVVMAASQPRVGSAALELLALFYEDQFMGMGCLEHRAEKVPEGQPHSLITSDMKAQQGLP